MRQALANKFVSFSLQDSLECQLCKFLVQAVDMLVGENKTIAAINSTLRDFCNNLPGELKDTVSKLPTIFLLFYRL